MKMELLPGIRPIGLAAYIATQKTLVIGDTHIGYEAALNKQGILLPRFQFKKMIVALENIFKRVRPETVVLLGDIKHEFGSISDQEWRDTIKLLDFLEARAKVVIVRGNHDAILFPIAKKRDIPMVETYQCGDVLLCHGHKLLDESSEPFKKAKIIMISHEHPAVSIAEGARKETFKCFLVGKYRRKNLVVLPSFSLVTEGTDIFHEQVLSPFIKDVLSFQVFVVSDKVYFFGRARDIRKLAK